MSRSQTEANEVAAAHRTWKTAKRDLKDADKALHTATAEAEKTLILAEKVAMKEAEASRAVIRTSAAKRSAAVAITTVRTAAEEGKTE